VSSSKESPLSNTSRVPKWAPRDQRGLPPGLFLQLVKTVVEDLGIAPPEHVEMDPLDAFGVVVQFRSLSYVIQGRKVLARNVAEGDTAVFEVHGHHTTTSSEVLDHIDRRTALILDKWVISLTYLDVELTQFADKYKSRGFFDLRVSSQ
jgi:hypothetical protein